MIKNNLFFINNLLKIKSTDPDKQRKGWLLNLFLFLSIVANTCAVVPTFFYGRIYLLIHLVLLILFLILFFINKNGFTYTTGVIFCFICTFALPLFIDMNNFEKIFIIFAFPVMISSFILLPWASYATSLLILVSYSFFYYFKTGQMQHNFYFMIGLFLISFVSWVTSRNLERALKQKQRSIQDLRKSFDSLHTSEERFRQLAENINEVFWIQDSKTKEILYVSPVFEKLWEFETKKLIQNSEVWKESILEEDKEKIERFFHSERDFTIEYRIKNSNNEVKWVRDSIFPIRNKQGEVYRLARISEDVSEYKKAEEKLIYLAYHDMLTNLLNRKAFYEKLDDSLIQAQRSFFEKSRALFFLDLDNYKEVNDSLGHYIGDKVLIEMTERVRSCLRKSDYIFRLEGDEFSILLSHITKESDTAIVAQKIIEKITSPFVVEGHEVFIGASIGIALYPKDGKNVDALIKSADAALFEAKKEKNKYIFYDNYMNIETLKRMTIEKQLRKAIEKDEMFFYFQPIVNHEGQIVAVEALLRWINGELGFIPPGEFIPIAEDSGLIILLGDYVLDKACKALAKWSSSYPVDFKLAVNISAKQFKQRNFIEKVKTIIKNNNINPALLEIEVTESSVMENPFDTIEKMKALALEGIKFSIDDFGTGYSSLSYIKKFPIHNLKIDQSFIQDVNSDSDNKEIVKAIIAMSHNLEISVIAEGVETKEQLDLLKSLNCDEIQGYYISKPMPEDEFINFYNKNRGNK